MKAIYRPAGQAAEYGTWAGNPYKGCGHGCAYCYVPAVLHMPRAEFDAGAILRPGFLEAFEHDAAKLQKQGKSINIFFSFTTDLYHPGDTSASRTVLELTRQYGHTFTVLTKGGTRAMRDADLFRPGLDHFASTLTSLDEAFAAKWERGAALPADRIATLKTFHERGIFTWVSLEPTLDVNASLDIVCETHHFVDFYKVGQANYLPMTKTTDWRDYTLRMVDEVRRLNVRAYFKKDLQAYLPADYKNEMLEVT
jgi:DNA repair photolyase